MQAPGKAGLETGGRTEPRRGVALGSLRSGRGHGRGGVTARPRQAPPLGQRKRAQPRLPDLGVTPRAHARALHAGKAPARRPFCLVGFLLEEVFSASVPAEEVGDRVAGVFLRGCQGWREQPLKGSTMISAAQLLDELMGRDRNLAPDEKRSNVRWDHESVSPAGLGPVPGRRGGGKRRGLGPAGPAARLGAGVGPGPRRCRVSEPVAGGSRERGPGGRRLAGPERRGRFVFVWVSRERRGPSAE